MVQQLPLAYCLQLMSREPLGSNGLPPWDGVLIHYTCDPNRSDIVLLMSHMIADGHLILKLPRQITVPLDAAAKADYAVEVLGARPSSSSRSSTGEQQQHSRQQHMWLLRPVFFIAFLFMAVFRYVNGACSLAGINRPQYAQLHNTCFHVCLPQAVDARQSLAYATYLLTRRLCVDLTLFGFILHCVQVDNWLLVGLHSTAILHG
jgi:hypothetical protein